MDTANVQEHFHKTAKEFDSIYTGEKSTIGKLLDRWLRWDMYERYRMTMDECQNIEGKRVLDIGTGTGRFLFPLVAKNPEKLVGIDFAPAMIELAHSIARKQGFEKRVEFIVDDFQTYKFDELFHISIAIGLFDYFSNALPVMEKIRQVTSEKAVMTFPNRRTFRALIRKVRLKVRGCPVYFYTLEDIDRLIQKSGFRGHRTRLIGKIFFTVAEI